MTHLTFGENGTTDQLLCDLGVSALEIGAAATRRVMVVSSRLFREALRQLLGDLSATVCDGGATVAETMPDITGLSAPDLVICVVLGETMRDLTFADIARTKRRVPKTRWIVLTDAVSTKDLRAAATAGVDSLLPHDISGRVLLHAAELVLLGQTMLPPLLMDERAPAVAGVFPLPEMAESAQCSQDAAEPAPMVPTGMPMSIPHLPRLSERERQILDCLVRGFSNKLIARHLAIADATVKVHVKGLLRKLQVANRTQAAILALDMTALSGSAAELVALPRTPPRLSVVAASVA